MCKLLTDWHFNNAETLAWEYGLGLDNVVAIWNAIQFIGC